MDNTQKLDLLSRIYPADEMVIRFKDGEHAMSVSFHNSTHKDGLSEFKQWRIIDEKSQVKMATGYAGVAIELLSERGISDEVTTQILDVALGATTAAIQDRLDTINKEMGAGYVDKAVEREKEIVDKFNKILIDALIEGDVNSKIDDMEKVLMGDLSVGEEKPSLRVIREEDNE